MVAIALVWIFSTERDRAASRIVLIASLASFALVELVTHRITGAWKLVIPGAEETLTIYALYRWAHNRTGFLQSACLVIAWAAHVICYVDVKLGTDLIYSHYRSTLALVGLAQILCFYDTFATQLIRAATWLNSLGLPRSNSLRVAGVRGCVLRGAGVDKI